MYRLTLVIILGISSLFYGQSSDITVQYQEILDTAENKYTYNKNNDYFLMVSTADQKMYVIKNQQIIKTYIISTGKAGEGNIIYSKKTPLGYLKVAEKVGDKAPLGTIFVKKQNTGEISKIYTDKTDIQKDSITTRIFHLDGLEKNYNKDGNVDAYRRGIFIHGTHEEGLLGEKASNGCIRMSNEEVIELFNMIPSNTILYVY